MLRCLGCDRNEAFLSWLVMRIWTDLPWGHVGMPEKALSPSAFYCTCSYVSSNLIYLSMQNAFDCPFYCWISLKSSSNQGRKISVYLDCKIKNLWLGFLHSFKDQGSWFSWSNISIGTGWSFFNFAQVLFSVSWFLTPYTDRCCNVA